MIGPAANVRNGPGAGTKTVVLARPGRCLRRRARRAGARGLEAVRTAKPERRRVADEIGRALEEAPASAKGDASAAVRVHHVRVLDTADVRALRQRLGLTQAAFTRRYDFMLDVLRDWKHGHHRRRP
jgi:DNA-binding transcriptional regulator YiaG